MGMTLLNVLSFHLASGGHFWYIPGCYLAPYDAFTVADVITEISQRPRVAALLVVGDLNTDLAAPEGRAWDQEIAAAMATSGLEGFSGHFFPWYKPRLRDGRTWCMYRRGKEVCYLTNYILGTDRRLLHNVVVQDTQHNTNHYLVLRFLRRAASTAHLRYLGKQTCLPIKLPTTPERVNHLAADLRGVVT